MIDVTMSNRDITGRQVAQELGVTDATVSRWRSGRVLPDPHSVAQIAHVLGLDPQRAIVTAHPDFEDVLGVDPLPVPERKELGVRELETRLREIEGLSTDSRRQIVDFYRQYRESHNDGDDDVPEFARP